MNSARSIDTALGCSVVREMERLDQQRAAMFSASSAMDVVRKQMAESVELMRQKAMLSGNSTVADHIKHLTMGPETTAQAMLKACQPPTLAALAQHSQDLRGPGAALQAMLKSMRSTGEPVPYTQLMAQESSAQALARAFQESERERSARMRSVFGSMADLRKGLLNISSAHQAFKAFTGGGAAEGGISALLARGAGAGTLAQVMAQQAEESRAHVRRLMEGAGVGATARRAAEEFERINRQWRVPGDALGVGETLRRVQKQLRGSIAVPSIDWATAAALARAMGPTGLEEQLALVGIAPDGTMAERPEQPERGLLSRKSADAIALASLLLSLLLFFYQEHNSAVQQAKTDAELAGLNAKLDAQTKQLEGLATLINQALAQAAHVPEDRYRVRNRPAAVRSHPEHGAAVEGQLMPNEVVRAIEKDGKWVEVEYYHWLEEEYRTGWVLKKYLKRVPASYDQGAK